MARQANTNLKLEHLYHGHFTEAGRPVGDPRLIAYSAGVDADQWRECLRLAPIIPRGDDETSGADSDAVGLFHSRTSGNILAHARRNWAADGVSNPPTIHYLLLPTQTANALAGNLTSLYYALLDKETPTFPTLESALPLCPLIVQHPPTLEDRMASLTTLLDHCRSDTRTVRGLLATVVQGQPLAIINSRLPTRERLEFIQGLLSLLPAPAHARVTFVTNVARSVSCPAQLKFLATDTTADDDQVFDWEQTRLTTSPPRDTYCSFVVGQMQLDPVGLMKRLDLLAEATQHRLETLPLPKALAEISRRITMDIALAEGQPIDRDAVVALLEQDPTLKGKQRVDYALYLLRLTLALDEPEPADVLVPLLQEDRSLTTAMLRQLGASARAGQAGAAYHLLIRWLDTAPALRKAHARAFGAIALAYLRELVAAQSAEAAISLLEELERIPAAFDLRSCARQILRASLPLARKNSRLARAVLCLAAHYLEAADFDSLLADSALREQFPTPVQTALDHLRPAKPGQLPGKGVLLHAAEALGAQGDAVLARLAEQAVASDRHDLVDVPVLERLRLLAQSEHSTRFVQVLRYAVWALARSEALPKLPKPGPSLMAQILLVLDFPEDFAQLLIHYQGVLFGPHRRDEFRELVRRLFQDTFLPAQQTIAALQAVEEVEGFDRWALALAYQNTIAAHQWDAAVERATDRLTSKLIERADLVTVVGLPFTVELLAHAAERQDNRKVIRLAAPLFAHLPEQAPEAAPILRRVWPLLTRNADMHQRAIELLRLYARRIPLDQASLLPHIFGDKRAMRERDTLAATLALRPIFDGRDLHDLAKDVETAASFFSDLIVTFERSIPPGPKRLTREICSLSGGLAAEDRAVLARQSLALARYIEQLGEFRNRDEEALIANRAVPRSAVGLMRWLGGYFAEGRPRQRTLPREAPPHAFGTRSAPMLCREIDATADLMASFLRVFPPHNSPELKLESLRGEVQSRWERLRLFEQRQLRGTLARDCQTLAALIDQMADTGGSKSFLGADAGQQIEEGKAPPRSVIDVLHWISGYYAGKHRPID